MIYNGRVTNHPFIKKHNWADWYEIEIEGHLDPDFSEWFDGLTITHPVSDRTSISGRVVDQAALHGLLAKVRDLNIRLLSVKLRRKKRA